MDVGIGWGLLAVALAHLARPVVEKILERVMAKGIEQVHRLPVQEQQEAEAVIAAAAGQLQRDRPMIDLAIHNQVLRSFTDGVVDATLGAVARLNPPPLAPSNAFPMAAPVPGAMPGPGSGPTPEASPPAPHFLNEPGHCGVPLVENSTAAAGSVLGVAGGAD